VLTRNLFLTFHLTPHDDDVSEVDGLILRTADCLPTKKEQTSELRLTIEGFALPPYPAVLRRILIEEP
jgi:hypothetical protein